MTTKNLGLAEEALADLEGCPDPRKHLEAALAHVAAALEVFDPEHMGYQFESTTRVRDRIAEKLAALD